MTKTQQRIVEAVARGYYIVDGLLFSKRQLLSIKRCGTQRYPTFSTNWGGLMYSVPVHQFAAFFYYGAKSFNPKLCVRHRDGNTENFKKSNIILGTPSENNLDKPSHIRIKAAKMARAAQGSTPTNAKLSPDQVREIRDAYNELNGKKAPNGFTKNLCDKYGVSRTVICKVVNHEYYPKVK